MKSIKKLFAMGLALMMALSIPFSVSAAELEDAPIDESRTGSLTIYKYDLTNAEKDGVWDSSYVSTGVFDQTGVNDVLGGSGASLGNGETGYGYTGSFESTVENHLNTIKNLKTLDEYKEFILSRVNERLTNDYFDITLVGSEGLAVSGRGNNAWNAYVASLNIMNAKILFSKSNLLVSKLFEPGTDGNRKSLEKHHLFPKAYLKSQGYSDAKINQMANYAFIDWKDNMDILDDAPSVYYPIVCAGLSDEQIRVMEEENALPHGWENMPYEDFLIERRKLMAAKIKAAFEILKKAAT